MRVLSERSSGLQRDRRRFICFCAGRLGWCRRWAVSSRSRLKLPGGPWPAGGAEHLRLVSGGPGRWELIQYILYWASFPPGAGSPGSFGECTYDTKNPVLAPMSYLMGPCSTGCGQTLQWEEGRLQYLPYRTGSSSTTHKLGYDQAATRVRLFLALSTWTSWNHSTPCRSHALNDVVFASGLSMMPVQSTISDLLCLCAS